MNVQGIGRRPMKTHAEQDVTSVRFRGQIAYLNHSGTRARIKAQMRRRERREVAERLRIGGDE